MFASAVVFCKRARTVTLKGRFRRCKFCLRLSHMISVGRAAYVMQKKSYATLVIEHCLHLPTIVVGFKNMSQNPRALILRVLHD